MAAYWPRPKASKDFFDFPLHLFTEELFTSSLTRGVAILDDSSTSLSSRCCRRSAVRVLSPLVTVSQLTAIYRRRRRPLPARLVGVGDVDVRRGTVDHTDRARRCRTRSRTVRRTDGRPVATSWLHHTIAHRRLDTPRVVAECCQGRLVFA